MIRGFSRVEINYRPEYEAILQKITDRAHRETPAKAEQEFLDFDLASIRDVLGDYYQPGEKQDYEWDPRLVEIGDAGVVRLIQAYKAGQLPAMKDLFQTAVYRSLVESESPATNDFRQALYNAKFGIRTRYHPGAILQEFSRSSYRGTMDLIDDLVPFISWYQEDYFRKNVLVFDFQESPIYQTFRGETGFGAELEGFKSSFLALYFEWLGSILELPESRHRYDFPKHWAKAISNPALFEPARKELLAFLEKEERPSLGASLRDAHWDPRYTGPLPEKDVEKIKEWLQRYNYYQESTFKVREMEFRRGRLMLPSKPILIKGSWVLALKYPSDFQNAWNSFLWDLGYNWDFVPNTFDLQIELSGRFKDREMYSPRMSGAQNPDEIDWDPRYSSMHPRELRARVEEWMEARGYKAYGDASYFTMDLKWDDGLKQPERPLAILAKDNLMLALKDDRFHPGFQEDFEKFLATLGYRYTFERILNIITLQEIQNDRGPSLGSADVYWDPRFPMETEEDLAARIMEWLSQNELARGVRIKMKDELLQEKFPIGSRGVFVIDARDAFFQVLHDPAYDQDAYESFHHFLGSLGLEFKFVRGRENVLVSRRRT